MWARVGFPVFLATAAVAVLAVLVVFALSALQVVDALRSWEPPH